MVKNLPTMRETLVLSLCQEKPLEEGMATHSSILAWRIPWTEEPSRLQWGHKELDVTERLTLLPIGSDGAFQVLLVVKNLPANTKKCKECGLNPWVGKIPWRRSWQPTLIFLPGESGEQRNLAGYSP